MSSNILSRLLINLLANIINSWKYRSVSTSISVSIPTLLLDEDASNNRNYSGRKNSNSDRKTDSIANHTCSSHVITQSITFKAYLLVTYPYIPQKGKILEILLRLTNLLWLLFLLKQLLDDNSGQIQTNGQNYFFKSHIFKS